MWRVIFVLTVLSATCEPHSKKNKPVFNKNQRIIKLQGPPHFNHFHTHQKPFRKRPFGPHPGEEVIRPNHPPPIPPFFNGPSTNHIKHPRPPPHVFHKTPSYGLGFPYKISSAYRPILSKDKFHLKGSSSPPVRSIIGSSTIGSSAAYHLPKFTSTSFVSSPPVTHIISSDDNNGPIREIPAPNLAPKPHEIAFDGVVGGDLSGVTGIGIGGVGHIHGVEGIGGVGGIHGVEGIGGNGGIHGVEGIGGNGGIHGVEGIIGNGGIHGGGNSAHGTSGVDEISSVAAVGGVTHLEPEALLNTVAKSPTGVNLDAIVKDQGVEVHPYLQESGGELVHGKGSTVEIANFDQGSSIDVTGLIKDAGGSSGHHSGYEVTEHHDHLPSNDQIIKGHDGSKLYYAPDPDPSLPVQKVPPTHDPHSTPSNGQSINSVFLQQVPHGYSYVQGGGLAAPLSSQELFHLMHGYPAVISQPVVAFVSQPQTSGIVLPNAGGNYYQQSSAGGYAGHYSSDEHEGNDISQYLQQPDIHNLLHNSQKSHYEQDVLGSSHSSVVSPSDSSQQGYTQSQYRTSVKSDYSGSETSNSGGFPTSHVNHNYQYEPDASETNNRHSLTVIRQTNEGSLSSETVKELLLEDSASNEVGLNQQERNTATNPTVLQLKNIPEVPFYASLPSKKAAEALASLQAAGSIASDYMSKIKVTRGDQGPEEEQKGRSRWPESERRSLEEEAEQSGRQKTVVEVRESVPMYETSISAKNLVENSDDDEEEESVNREFSSEGAEEEEKEEEQRNSDFGGEGLSEAFGRRIRPK